jgi:hypothetical protein
MSMLVSNRSEYVGKYSPTDAVSKLKKIGDIVMAFTPFFWVSLFVLLTVLAKIIGG